MGFGRDGGRLRTSVLVAATNYVLFVNRHPHDPDGRGGGGRHIRHLHGFVDGADLGAVTDAERLGEVGAAVGIDDRADAGATDRDIDRARIDGVGAEARDARARLGGEIPRRRAPGLRLRGR